MVDSCRECEHCKDGLEQFCDPGNTLTFNSPDVHLGGQTFGGYSQSIVVDENYVLHISDKLDLAGVAPLLCAGITTYSPLKTLESGSWTKSGYRWYWWFRTYGNQISESNGRSCRCFYYLII